MPDRESTEREMLEECAEQIVDLVVRAMKNFRSSETILNRACLVLHNLSLTQDYHSKLLWTRPSSVLSIFDVQRHCCY